MVLQRTPGRQHQGDHRGGECFAQSQREPHGKQRQQIDAPFAAA